MPLRNRRPQLLSLSIQGSSSSVGTDEVHTPLPITPLAYSWNQGNAPLIMTPDTPFFDMSSAGGMFGKSVGSDVGGDIVPAEPEWTEEEDEMLQSYLSRPASTRAYPPGTLPPADVLDTMTTQILSRLSRSASVSSASSTDTELDIDMDEEDTTPTPKPAGWSHSWSATRARLFRIARLESREALGGHTRNNSESMVPVPKEKLVRPKLVVLGSAGMSRQQHSMDNILGSNEQTIDEAVKLSSALQGKAMDSGSSSVLHSTQDLSSPVTFEFGPSINFTGPSTSAPLITAPSLPLPRNSLNRKALPAFPSAKGLPRPSLLQRGRSYTGADLARERGHSRTTSASSDEFTGSDVADMSSSPMSSGNSLLALPPFRPMMRRSATSPTAFVFPSSSQSQSPALSATSQSLTDDSEPDPITPLNQTTFPRSAIGLGNRTLTGCSSDSDSTPGGTPAITLTRTSPTSSPIEGPTPRIGSSFSGDSPMSEFANLTLNSSALPSSMGNITRPTRPDSLTRSLSEAQSVSALLNPAGIPSSTSHPSDLNFQLSGAGSTNSLPMTRPCLSMSAIEDAPRRENKRQRAMPFPGSSAAVFRPRLNPGLKVVVPPQAGLTALGLGGGLRSPFEHKTPGGSVKI